MVAGSLESQIVPSDVKIVKVSSSSKKFTTPKDGEPISSPAGVEPCGSKAWSMKFQVG